VVGEDEKFPKNHEGREEERRKEEEREEKSSLPFYLLNREK
jgi:hypothetical protein